MLFQVSENVFATVLREDIEWKREWFTRKHKYGSEYWESQENCRIFLDSVAKENGIATAQDWRRVTSSVIKKKGGMVKLLPSF